MLVTPFSSANVTVQTLAYTVPAGRELLAAVDFCNRGTVTATANIWVVPSGEMVGDQHTKESALTLSPAGYSGHVLQRKPICPPGTKIYVQASSSNVSCQVSGDETPIT